jgi:hypothetical protein
VFTLPNGTRIPDLEIVHADRTIYATIYSTKEKTNSIFNRTFAWHMTEGENLAKLDGIEATPTIRGSDMLQLGIELSKEFHAKYLMLEDASTVEVTSNVRVSLSWLHLFMSGKTWYQSKGFIPDVDDYPGYLREVNSFRSYPMQLMLWTLLPMMEQSVAQFLSSISDYEDLCDTMFLTTNPDFGTRLKRLLLKLASPKKTTSITTTKKWVPTDTIRSFPIRVTRIGDATQVKVYDDYTTILNFEVYSKRAYVIELDGGTYQMQLLQLAEEIAASYDVYDISFVQEFGVGRIHEFLSKGLTWYHMMGYLPEGFSLDECYQLQRMANEIKLGQLYSFPEVYEGETVAQYMIRLWQEGDRMTYAQNFDLMFTSEHPSFPWTAAYQKIEGVIRTDHTLFL